jgi:hypothetical protein
MSAPIVITPSFQIFEPLERVTIFTPLGIRFWDAALDRQVRDGLVVTARRPGTNQRVVRAFRTRSGIYAFHGLPGLRALEYPADDAVLESSPPALTRFEIEVTDEQRRFGPTLFQVDVPFEGIYPTGNSDASTPPGVYLFSAPTRPAVSSLAVVRAQLVERLADGSEQPASFAVLEVEVAGGPPSFGIADPLGRVAVHFPYPRFTTLLSNGSPPASADGTASQRWEMRVRVRFDPSALEFLAGAAVPDLRSIFSQRAGGIQVGLGLPPGGSAPELVTELVFGREVVLRHPPGSTFVISRAV